MRFFNRFKNRGFTLVELMIVVAIIGVLAALAIYGVRRYLASAKTSEAKNSVGAIARGAVGAFERETTVQEVVGMGSSGTTFAHDVCDDAQNVPTSMASLAGKKYQSNQASGNDFELGDAQGGWKCLKFNMSSPQYYQYSYVGHPRSADGGGATAPAGVAAAPTPGFGAYAQGDLDGDSQFSAFGQIGAIDAATQSLRLATEINISDEYE